MKTLLLILLLIPYTVCSQNLVLNPSFEDTLDCPPGPSNLNFSEFWQQPTGGTSDFFHPCSATCTTGYFGFQLPKDSIAYAGGSVGSPNGNYVEYLEGTLASPLIAGECYQFSFYANIANNYKYSTDGVQAYFSTSLISGISGQGLLPYTPQVINPPGNLLDTLNWTLIQGEFAAIGGESYVIIGNFIDYQSCTWSISNNLSAISSCYVYYDDFSLINVPCTGVPEFNNLEIDLFPNPVISELNVSSNTNQNLKIQIFDSLMKNLYSFEFSNKLKINTDILSQGVYFLCLSQQ